jgi:hypothetical protein
MNQNKPLRAWRLLQRINPMIRKVDKRIYKYGLIKDIKRLDDLFKRREIIRKFL